MVNEQSGVIPQSIAVVPSFLIVIATPPELERLASWIETWRLLLTDPAVEKNALYTTTPPTMVIAMRMRDDII